MSENEKLNASETLKAHIEHSQRERDLYRQSIKKAREETPAERKEDRLPPLSADLQKIRYTFDYNQMATLPHHARQMGPLYFMSPRKIQIFGARFGGTPLQLNYLIDEDESIGNYIFEGHSKTYKISDISTYIS